MSGLVGGVWIVQAKIICHFHRRLAQRKTAVNFAVEHSGHGQQKSGLDCKEIVFSRSCLELALSLVPEAGTHIFEMVGVATS